MVSMEFSSLFDHRLWRKQYFHASFPVFVLFDSKANG